MKIYFYKINVIKVRIILNNVQIFNFYLLN